MLKVNYIGRQQTVCFAGYFAWEGTAMNKKQIAFIICVNDDEEYPGRKSQITGQCLP